MVDLIGDKIRKARRELNLSQQQLAGREMTRGFISLVEIGKCNPSPENLRLIAQRLGKPVEYFLQDEVIDTDTVEIIVALLDSAKRDLNADEPDKVHAAYAKLTKALQFSHGLGRQDLQADLRYLLVRCLRRMGNMENALEECELALECFRELKSRDGLARVYNELGAIAFELEDFAKARRAYEKSILYTAGLKSMTNLQVNSLSILGTCLFRLGHYDMAVQVYREALTACSALNEPQTEASIIMGLGGALVRAGNTEAAFREMKRAVSALMKLNSPQYVLALHNLALIEAERGNWERAYVTLQECMKTYKRAGQLDQQASVLEDLSRYWLHKGDLDRAEAVCWEALDLLDEMDNGILRARILRQLGITSVRRDNLVQARQMLRVSHALFSRMKANQEAEATLNELEKISVIPT